MRKVLFVILILLATGSVAAYFWSAAASKPQLVRTAQLEPLQLHSSINTNGKVEAERVYEVRAPFAGFCQKIIAREGDLMSAGQEILTIVDPSIQSSLQGARAELESAEVE